MLGKDIFITVTKNVNPVPVILLEKKDMVMPDRAFSDDSFDKCQLSSLLGQHYYFF